MGAKVHMYMTHNDFEDYKAGKVCVGYAKGREGTYNGQPAWIHVEVPIEEVVKQLHIAKVFEVKPRGREAYEKGGGVLGDS